jgi:hypothetical protein
MEKNQKEYSVTGTKRKETVVEDEPEVEGQGKRGLSLKTL